MNPHIIGLTGSFGSGCSYIAKNILAPKGYTHYSLSDELKLMFQSETGENPADVPRRKLQDFGDELRRKKGSGFLSEEIIDKILKECKEDKNKKFVVDSIRNPGEIAVFRRESGRFFLFGVYADKKVRWERVEEKYKSNLKDFDQDDNNDTGGDNPTHGQHVGDCFYESDIVILNNDYFETEGNENFKAFEGNVDKYLQLVSQPLQRQKPIRTDESLMAMAYAASQRSSCMKRKVGAVIVDPEGNVISSGFNEVPRKEQSCEKKYKKCYRTKVRKDFFQQLVDVVPQAQQKKDKLIALIQKQFKVLDYCRALHAEENAIVNLARNGHSIPLEKCTLYTTLYPCRMCANKIVQVGIREVVYFEPYPDPAAKVILGDCKQRSFQGVTFRAYFRLYGEQR